jgi:hypothetical protein
LRCSSSAAFSCSGDAPSFLAARTAIAYSTVIVKGGRVFFYPDLYGHDRLLDQALRQRSH